VLPRKALEDLKKLHLEYEVIFEKYKYKFLFGKVEPIADKSLVRFINKDLAYTCEIGNIPYNMKSHSFRINVISSLLRVTSVQNTADINNLALLFVRASFTPLNNVFIPVPGDLSPKRNCSIILFISC
jgi:hypothetical protein